jgi:hypothetical protein
MVLCLSAWGTFRLLAALRWWDVLYEFGASLSPLYLFLSGAGWAAAGAILFWSQWTGKRWAYRAFPAAILLWLAGYWLERLFFQEPRANLGFMVILTIVFLVVTFFIASRRSTRNFYMKSEEHEQRDEDTASA